MDNDGTIKPMMMDETQIQASTERHKATPEVSASAHFHERCMALGREMAAKHRIYLDTCFWVNLRKASFGQAQHPAYNSMLAALRSLVASGRVVCPVSDAMFIEAMQQTDRATRIPTARLFDELSGRVALRSETERIPMEMEGFMRFINGEPSSHRETLWVPPAFTLGVRLPSSEQLSGDANRLVQKLFIDSVWQSSFEAFAQVHAGDDFSAVMARSASRVNEVNAKYADSICTFKDAFTHEVSGSAKSFDDEVARMVLKERFPNYTPEQAEQFKATMQKALFNAFRLKPKIMAKHFPTLYAHAACHAAIRWDKQRKVDGNWLVDIHHACAACANHQAMFTEGPLKVLMMNGNLKFHETFNLTVIANPAEALQYLQNIH